MKSHLLSSRVQPAAHNLEQHTNVLRITLGAYLVLAALGIATLAFMVHASPYLPVDLALTREIQSVKEPWFAWLMWNVNWLGFGIEATSLVALTVLVTYLAGWRWAALVGAIDAATIWAINIAIGWIVARPYPVPGPEFNGLLVDLTKPSFPGGHASSFIAFYGFMWYLVYTRVKKLWPRLPLLLFFGALMVLVVPSRVYMGRHWPTDTLAAVLLGTIWLILSILLYQWSKVQPWVRRHFADRQAVWQR